MEGQDFETLVRRIRNALNCSKDLAVEYARGMGDSPEIQAGQVLVRNEERRIIARVPQSVLEG